MNNEDRLHVMIGKADLFELLSSAFAFPTEYLAQALANGAFITDWVACWRDIVGDGYPGYRPGENLPAFENITFGVLKREYSLLYLFPGQAVRVWPYEGCFLYRESGREGVPGLFRTPVCLDVEKQMRDAGVAARESRKIPADSIDRELGFLSYLWGKAAEAAINASDGSGVGESSESWVEKANVFTRTHVLNWMTEFMEQTRERTSVPAYRELSGLALSAFKLIEEE